MSEQVTTVVRGFGYEMTHVVTVPRSSLHEAEQFGYPYVGFAAPVMARCGQQPRTLNGMLVSMESGTPVRCKHCQRFSGIKMQTEESRAYILSDRTPSIDLADWYPYVVAAGVDTPRTEIVKTQIDLTLLLDGEKPEGFEAFLSQLTRKANRIGYPLFMRTGYGSGKHQWLDTCYLQTGEDLGQHVFNLVLWSHTVDMLGLPIGTWVLRELMPVRAPFRAYHGMPVARERRYFIDDSGAVIGHHPYWPPDAVEAGGPEALDAAVQEPDWQRLLEVINEESDEEIAALTQLTERVGAVIPGSWSVDWLDVPGRGWVCIDLAHLDSSFIWTEYLHAPKDVEKRWHEVGQEWWTVGSGKDD
jgi:hypothetical protein